MKVQVKVSTEKFAQCDAQMYVMFMQEGFDANKIFKDFIAKTTFSFKSYFEEIEFSGKVKSVVNFPAQVDDHVVHFVCIGVGGKVCPVGIDRKEVLRRGIGSAIKVTRGKKIKDVAVLVPEASFFETEFEQIAEQITTISIMAGYQYDVFMSRFSNAKKSITVHLVVPKEFKQDAQYACDRGTIIGEAVNTTREYVDTPPAYMTPTIFAEKVQELTKACGMKCTVLEDKKMEQLGMGGVLGVARGSVQAPKFIIAEYKGGKKGAKTIALVGKGITFDSGGICIKPGNSMLTMKGDMAGAAAVFNVACALAHMKAPVNIVAVAPVTENMPGPHAQKPGDIVRFYNGKTAEIKDTDAEGRLVLADALSYTVDKIKPDIMIDIATLTGACEYAVGPYYAALISEHDDLAQQLSVSGNRTGDRVWRLPYTDDYKEAIKSNIADMANTGTRNKAGTITASAFLQHFVGDVPWAHLDIASGDFDIPVSYFDTGSTGIAVRLLIDFCLHAEK